MKSGARLPAFLVTVLLGSVPLGAQHITLLHTSDVHGHIFPFDYFRNRPAAIGLSRVASLVEGVRSEGHPVILLDGGDTIQGSPLAYYHHRRNPSVPDPMMVVMSEIGYDAMTVGNHEFNFGLKALDKSAREASFPWLAANIVRESDGEPYFTPYLVKEIEGARVGILGLTTPSVPNMESPENYAGLVFVDAVQTAKRYVPELRNRERVDAVVVLTHQGLGRDPAEAGAEIGYENPIERLIAEVPGIDAVLTGHTHREIAPKAVGDVVVCEPGRWGTAVCRLDFYFEKDGRDGIHLVRRDGALLDATTAEPSPKILSLAETYHRQTMGYIGSVIGHAVAHVSGDGARVRDTPLMDLLQQVMLEASGADLSMAALLPRSHPGFAAGPVTVQQIFSFYIYDNTLVVLEVTGRQVEEALEHSARYYRDARFDPETGRIHIVADPRILHYQFDVLAGAHYRIDPTRPPGDRVRDLTYRGRAVDPEDRFKLVTTSYRAAGGGGYSMFSRARVVWRSSEEIRNLLIESIRREGLIQPVCDHNWVVAPDVSPLHGAGIRPHLPD